MNTLGPRNPIDIALVEWLVENGHVGYAGLLTIRGALTADNVVLGFPPALFDAREDLLARVDTWIGKVEERVRQTNRAAGLGDHNDADDLSTGEED